MPELLFFLARIQRVGAEEEVRQRGGYAQRIQLGNRPFVIYRFKQTQVGIGAQLRQALLEHAVEERIGIGKIAMEDDKVRVEKSVALCSTAAVVQASSPTISLAQGSPAAEAANTLDKVMASAETPCSSEEEAGG